MRPANTIMPKQLIKTLTSQYDSEYFEDGIRSGKSCYEHFRWIECLSVEWARLRISELTIGGEDEVLDFGCAKGFLVRAFRQLGVKAFGCDVSAYAIEHADPIAAPWLRHMPYPTELPFAQRFAWTIAKDVLEHIPSPYLETALRNLRHSSDGFFAVVPLGDGERFIVDAYEKDVTHVNRQPVEWWQRQLELAGWTMETTRFDMTGIKDSWKDYEGGNVAIVCS